LLIFISKVNIFFSKREKTAGLVANLKQNLQDSEPWKTWHGRHVPVSSPMKRHPQLWVNSLWHLDFLGAASERKSSFVLKETYADLGAGKLVTWPAWLHGRLRLSHTCHSVCLFSFFMVLRIDPRTSGILDNVPPLSCSPAPSCHSGTWSHGCWNPTADLISQKLYPR
jgi:hypothetical protein